VKKGDVDTCKKILENKPKAIRSVDRKGKFKSAPQIAIENKDWTMLKFLASQPFIDFEITDEI
jgi:hypothetical protein